jgi:hypothetical protein
MSRDVEMDDASAIMCKDDKDKQNVEPNGVYREEVDRDELRDVIGEEDSPCLGWRFRLKQEDVQSAHDEL